MVNLITNEVDVLHRRMQLAGAQIVIPLTDNPWGDRGFGVLDPAGVVLYCHTEIEPASEFHALIQKSPDLPRGA